MYARSHFSDHNPFGAGPIFAGLRHVCSANSHTSALQSNRCNAPRERLFLLSLSPAGGHEGGSGLMRFFTPIANTHLDLITRPRFSAIPLVWGMNPLFFDLLVASFATNDVDVILVRYHCVAIDCVGKGIGFTPLEGPGSEKDGKQKDL